MDPLMITAAFVGIIFILLLYMENRVPDRYPKGPFKLPLLGSIPIIFWERYVKKKYRHEIYADWVKVYGPVFSMKMGPYRSVVLNDAKLIKEAWSNPNLCGRPKMAGAAVRTEGEVRGILFQDGDEWLEQRRFALRNLRDFGFGKRSMESLVLDEADELLSSLRNSKGKGISTQNRFNIAVLNSLWRIVTGERFSHEDERLKMIMDSINRSLDVPGFGLVFLFPILKTIAPKLSGWEAYVNDVTQSTYFVKEFVAKRLQAFENSGEPQDFADAYIQEIKRTSDQNSSFHGARGEKTMLGTLLDLFVAGAETTSTTLSYFCLYMAMFPEKQEKICREIEAVLGRKQPSLQDREKLPYTEAAIMETLRFSAMVPLGILHRALEDTELGGYRIPKGTFLTANLYAVHHSKEIWGDPENFRPERFLSPDSGKVVKSEYLMAFSWGKRLCPGETLAKDELFLFVTSILQEFSVCPDPESSEPLTLEPRFANIISPPKPHTLVFKLRKTE